MVRDPPTSQQQPRRRDLMRPRLVPRLQADGRRALAEEWFRTGRQEQRSYFSPGIFTLTIVVSIEARITVTEIIVTMTMTPSRNIVVLPTTPFVATPKGPTGAGADELWV